MIAIAVFVENLPDFKIKNNMVMVDKKKKK
jgi:hypothetical protein